MKPHRSMQFLRSIHLPCSSRALSKWLWRSPRTRDAPDSPTWVVITLPEHVLYAMSCREGHPSRPLTLGRAIGDAIFSDSLASCLLCSGAISLVSRLAEGSSLQIPQPKGVGRQSLAQLAHPCPEFWPVDCLFLGRLFTSAHLVATLSPALTIEAPCYRSTIAQTSW